MKKSAIQKARIAVKQANVRIVALHQQVDYDQKLIKDLRKQIDDAIQANSTHHSENQRLKGENLWLKDIVNKLASRC